MVRLMLGQAQRSMKSRFLQNAATGALDGELKAPEAITSDNLILEKPIHWMQLLILTMMTAIPVTLLRPN